MDEFYMPRFSGDRLPASATGIAVSLAEKLDSLVGIFGIGMRPTGDKDPFALRRAALGALRILLEHRLPVDLRSLLTLAEDQLKDRLTREEVAANVYDFMIERLKGLYGDNGTAHGVFESVAAVAPRSIADFDRRMIAVAAFRQRPEGEALAAANKRIGNILRKGGRSGIASVDVLLFEHDAERALHEELALAREETAPAATEGDYVTILTRLSGLRAAVDRFFDDVMVMADDEAVRNNRLALLRSLSDQFMLVADISHLQA
jgi:glycyl-tRNA synthetase beta chain